MAAGSRVALVTGCSKGIGEATARVLAARGFRVYASGRTLEGVAHLRGPGIEPIEIDVRDEEGIARGVRGVVEDAGRIDVLVNNAGYALFGAVEDLGRETVRKQFEVNVFGAWSVCHHVLPAMRRQGGGTIVNVSSVAGTVSVPLLGAYCASKFALEAMSDALRVEARPFGIRVVVVEPGTTFTEFQRRAVVESQESMSNAASPYAHTYDTTLRSYTTPALGATPEDVARRIARIAGKRAPAARYRVKWWDTLGVGFAQVLPRRFMDAFLSRWLGLHRLRSP